MIQGKIYPFFTAQDEPETEEIPDEETETPTEAPKKESGNDDEESEEEISDI